MAEYLRGYSTIAAARLGAQAASLEELLHGGSAFADGTHVLEAGCGVGAQTEVLARRHPGARFTSVDISEASLAHARARIATAGIDRVSFLHADLLALPFDTGSFDHIFMNFVLEHCGNPAMALHGLHRVLRPGGTITVIEPDHTTTAFHPSSPATCSVYEGMVRAQAAMGGDGRIGHRLFPLLQEAGFHVEMVEPRVLYVDGRLPERVAAIIGGVVVPALETTRGNMIRLGGLTTSVADQGLAEWRNLVANPQCVFATTLFKALGRKSAAAAAVTTKPIGDGRKAK